MTLRCKCGGEVRIQDGSDPDRQVHWELYKCVTCGQTGTYTFDDRTGNDRMSGCLTSTFDEVAV